MYASGISLLCVLSLLISLLREQEVSDSHLNCLVEYYESYEFISQILIEHQPHAIIASETNITGIDIVYSSLWKTWKAVNLF